MLYVFYLIDIDINAFDGHNLKVILTTDYYTCCIAPIGTICTAVKPWFISCSDILPKHNMKILFRTTSFLILVLNIGSVLIHLVAKKSKMSFKITVMSLNISNFLCFS